MVQLGKIIQIRVVTKRYQCSLEQRISCNDAWNQEIKAVEATDDGKGILKSPPIKQTDLLAACDAGKKCLHPLQEKNEARFCFTKANHAVYNLINNLKSRPLGGLLLSSINEC